MKEFIKNLFKVLLFVLCYLLFYSIKHQGFNNTISISIALTIFFDALFLLSLNKKK